jgi:hypothetical protein
VQSRYFYCCAYEVLAKQSKDFTTLVKLLDEGHNITICGYDAYPVTKNIYEHYCDPTKPFGHEMVLYALLTRDPCPWHLYKELHPEIYENMKTQ